MGAQYPYLMIPRAVAGSLAKCVWICGRFSGNHYLTRETEAYLLSYLGESALTVLDLGRHPDCAVSDASGAGCENPISHRRTSAKAGRFSFARRSSMAASAGQAHAWPVPMCRFLTPVLAATSPRREKRPGGSKHQHRSLTMKSPICGQATPENRPDSSKTPILPDFGHRISANESPVDLAGLCLERVIGLLRALAELHATDGDLPTLLDMARLEIQDATAILAAVREVPESGEMP
jgi:hypothetical protein